jgi:hypothetical protein
LLNIVATWFTATGPWILVAFILALVGSLIVETEQVEHMDTVRIRGPKPERPLHLILWALLSAIIGAMIAGAIILLPLGDWSFDFYVGGIFGYQGVSWFWYDIAITLALVILACLSALRRRSLGHLLIFGIFSATGETLVITTFRFRSGKELLATFIMDTLFIVGFSALVYSRHVVLELLDENWGRPFSNRRDVKRPRQTKPNLELADQTASDSESPKTRGLNNG